MSENLLPIGTPIRYNVVMGSIGMVESYWKNSSGYYVRYHYGLDVKNQPITALGSLPAYIVVEISRTLFAEYTACRAWSYEQEEVRKRIIESTLQPVILR